MLSKEEIHCIFQNEYNRYDWCNLLSKIFGDKVSLSSSNPTSTEETKNEKIRSSFELGSIEVEKRKIKIYEVILTDNIKLERNRVGIRNLMRQHWKNDDGSFIVYHTENEPKHWRFSYVQENYIFNEELKISEKISTAPKRYTYLFGKSENVRTAVDRFSELNKDSTLEQIKDTFSVEKLSDEFFEKYKKHYQNFIEFFTGERVVKKNNKWETIKVREIKNNEPLIWFFDDNKKTARDFCKKLLGRIVFLYFVQEKRWLGNDKNFMKNYHNADYLDLSDLFFKALNTKRPNDDFELPNGKITKIPFLNGGLFENEYPSKKCLDIPKKELLDFFEFLEQYNFTIDENISDIEQIIGIDPEMLSRIFENLLEDNKDKGAFYTPKEIVKYMCEESLIEYLIEKTKIERRIIESLVKNKDSFNIEKTCICSIEEALEKIKICDPAIGSGAFPMGMLNLIFGIKEALNPNMDWRRAKTKLDIIQNSIYGVDIEKGAVDIARLRFWLSLIIDEQEPKPLPNLDFKIVEGDSLVSKFKCDDIEEFVNINWNFLNDKEGNLYKKEADKLKDNFNLLVEKQSNFFNESNAVKKEKLKKEIRNLKIAVLESQIEFEQKSYMERNFEKSGLMELSGKEKEKNCEIKTKKNTFKNILDKLARLKKEPEKSFAFFDWNLDFPEVMNPKLAGKTAQEKGGLNETPGGFDVVIGNPPYGGKYSENDKKYFQQNYNTAETIKNKQKGSLDTFTLFIEKGHCSLKTNGNLHFIVPISITSSDSMTGVHCLLENSCSLIKVSSYAVRPQPVFENAVVNTSILFFKKDNQRNESILATKMYRKSKNFNLQHLVNNLQFIEVKDIKLVGRYPKISLDIEKAILKKIFSQKKNIGDLIKEDGSPIWYRFAGGRYFKVITNYTTNSSAERVIYFEKKIANSIGAILSSNLYFWFYQIFSDNLNLKQYEIDSFGFPNLNDNVIEKLGKLYSDYLIDIEKNANTRTTTEKSSYNVAEFKEYKIGKSKHIIDKIDDLICPLYGLNKEETEFIKNYEIEFRLSDGE